MTDNVLGDWLARQRAREQELTSLLTSVVGKERAQGQMREIAQEVLDAIGELAADDRASSIGPALELLGELQECTNPIAGYHADSRGDAVADAKRRGVETPPLHELWRPKDIDAAFSLGEKYPKGVAIEQSDLSFRIFSYVRQRWANCIRLERLMLDALVYAEVDGFGRAIKERGLGFPTEAKPLFFRGLRRWSWLAIVSGLCGLGVGDIWGLWPGIATAVVVYQLMVIAYATSESHETAERLRVMKLLREMQAFYKGLAESQLSPAGVWIQFEELTRRGAVWKPGVAALIQHAMKRDPAAWQKA